MQETFLHPLKIFLSNLFTAPLLFLAPSLGRMSMRLRNFVNLSARKRIFRTLGVSEKIIESRLYECLTPT